MFEAIKTTIEEKIGIITLNRPEKRNPISIQMRKEISTCLEEWKNSDDIGSVIFTGEGAVFSAGFDLKEFGQPGRMEEIYLTSAKYHRDVWHFPKPVIAAVNGPAMGGAFDLATLCDVRICSENAAFGHPEIKFGAPPLFTPLRWIVGDGSARHLCLTGKTIDAREAFSIGLVSEIAPGGGLMEAAVKTAKTICEAPAATLATVKKYVTGNAGKGFEESFVEEHDIPFMAIVNRR